MSDQRPRVTAAALTRFTSDVLQSVDVPPKDADKVAEVLVWANRRGVDSHGVLRLPRYLRLVEFGLMNPKPNIRKIRETPASVVIEADRALGAVGMSVGMEHAIEKAKNVGIGWALIRGSTHSGAIGYFALQAARNDMIGMAISTSLPNMVYHGSRAAGVATSPIAIAAPGDKHPPLMLDMATGVVSFGKLAQARHTGEPIPEGWALTVDGEPTTDAAEAAIPMPLAGPKGSGLALMFECLTSILVGNPLISEDISAPPRGRRHNQNGLTVAIDPAAFTDPDQYKRDIDKTVVALKSLPTAEGTDEILVPGERGDRIRVERDRDGIPLAPGTWAALLEISAEHGIDMPETM